MLTRALILRGHQGTGKSTLGQELSQEHGFCLLSKDTIYLPAIEATQEHHVASRIAYNSILAILLANHKSGLSFVVDAPFHQLTDVERLIQACTVESIATKSILLVCNDKSIWQKRLAARKDERNANHQITDLDTLRAIRGSMASIALADEPILDTTDPVNTPAYLADICVQQVSIQPVMSSDPLVPPQSEHLPKIQRPY